MCGDRSADTFNYTDGSTQERESISKELFLWVESQPTMVWKSKGKESNLAVSTEALMR